mmetsp:Transcript_1103/g.2083  ORF Transcript_1103/g.2083 Transcript_1103/m.2083 type:complete len:263 (+) Transcript_1103:1-789(+)
MIDVVKNVQQLTVAKAPWEAPPDLPLSALASEHTGEPDVWRWATRRCGPCGVQARDLDMVDSSSFYEQPTHLPLGDQHVLQISAPAMIEFEVEATCCSQREWEISPAFEAYRQRLRFDRWLLVPPLFSPVRKVNYMVSAGEDGEEAVTLEVWTTKAARPQNLVRTSASTLLAALLARAQAEASQPGADAIALDRLMQGPASDAEEEYAKQRLADMPEGSGLSDVVDDDEDALSELLMNVEDLAEDGASEGVLRSLTDGLLDD